MTSVYAINRSGTKSLLLALLFGCDLKRVIETDQELTDALMLQQLCCKLEVMITAQSFFSPAWGRLCHHSVTSENSSYSLNSPSAQETVIRHKQK